MAQYLLSVWHDNIYEVDFEGDEMQRVVGPVDEFNSQLQTAGAWVYAKGVQPASSATVVRSADGEVWMTDGPYAESTEQMSGFWVIEVAISTSRSTGPRRRQSPVRARSRCDHSRASDDLDAVFRREAEPLHRRADPHPRRPTRQPRLTAHSVCGRTARPSPRRSVPPLH